MMRVDAHSVALATLRYWAERACGVPLDRTLAQLTPDLQRAVQQATTLVADTLNTEAGWPDLDLRQPLRSIFSRIQPLYAETAVPHQIFVRRASLSLHEDVLFPTKSVPEGEAKTHSEPIQSIRAALDRIDRQPALTSQARLETLFYTLQRHACSLPSPLDAVSLYDFARTHAAVAAARAADSSDAQPFLLGGDLSGVQDFIYTLTAEGATRQLRGRSFYLQLLTEAIAHYILTQAGLPLTNLLYSGGGRFYVLLPASGQNMVPVLRREIGARLLRRHAGALYVALGGAPYETDAQAAWTRLNEAIDAAKRRRFAALDADTLYRVLFTPRQPDLPPAAVGAPGAVPTDALSRSLEELSPWLHNTPYMLVRLLTQSASPPSEDDEPQAVSWHRVLQEFGLFFRPLRSVTQITLERRYARLLVLTDQPQDEVRLAQTALGERGVVGVRYTVNVTPTATGEDVDDYVESGLDREGEPLRPGDTKPFGLLVKQSQGIERLGILRMDVDDLGDLFGRRLVRSSGIGGLAYTAALSGALSRFFEGWVGELCRAANRNSPRGSVYAVYSGGDDLFIVGSWHLLPQLAATIRDDFVRYTSGAAPGQQGAPPVTISAGITLHRAKFPLYQAADAAHDALDAAKTHLRPDGRAKDALCLLGQVVGWENYAEVRGTQEQLCSLIRQGAPMALLTTIQSLYLRYSAGRATHATRTGMPQFSYGPWVWRGAYMLTRLAERSPAAIRPEVEQLRDRIIGEVERRFIEHAGLAARWAQLLIR